MRAKYAAWGQRAGASARREGLARARAARTRTCPERERATGRDGGRVEEAEQQRCARELEGGTELPCFHLGLLPAREERWVGRPETTVLWKMETVEACCHRCCA
eukprot:526984-Prymnesium_polylepis.1